MSVYSGSYRNRGDLYATGPKMDPRSGQILLRNRGVARALRAQKRQEAEARNARTEHERTRTHRRGRCSELVCHQ